MSPSPAAFVLQSRSISPDGWLRPRHTADGADLSPSLQWSGAPAETQEYALICEGLDAPLPRPFVHWIAWGIPASTSFLPEGLPAFESLVAPVQVCQGLNTFLRAGWAGPIPPPLDSAHRYTFRLYALRRPLELSPRAGRTEFKMALQGKVLAEAHLTVRYQRLQSERLRQTAQAVLGTLLLSGTLLVGTGLILGRRTQKKPIASFPGFGQT